MSQEFEEEIFGNRIPQYYFVTTGKGQTDQGSGIDPWETGAYDLALLDAHIENFNIMEYTSVLPPEAEEISVEEAMDKYFHHGAALESIMASINGYQGDRLCAGVGRIQVRTKKYKVHIGGFAAEYEGHATADVAKEVLHDSLMGIFNRRYNPDDYEPFGEKFKIIDFPIEKKYGTALAAICFVTYIYPMFL